MRRNILYISKYFLSLFFFMFSVHLYSQDIPIAFPGAEGFGKFTTGGRGGKVYIVTNLNDSGPGSLREAVEARGPRMVVFEVSGNIELKSRLNIGDSNITIAGQTAPGDGITIQNYPLRFIEKDNIIIRFLRFRLGDLSGKSADASEGRFCKNVIIDHCSFSWGTDETASFYANQNFTLQWSILSEGLNRTLNFKEDHAYGGLWGGNKASFHHNLIAHFASRNPGFDNPALYGEISNLDKFRGVVDFRNNLVYNWSKRAASGGGEGTINFINNYYKPGPATKANSHFLNPTGSKWGYGQFYVFGNLLESKPEVNANNWLGVRLESTLLTNQYLESTKLKNPLPTLLEANENRRILNSLNNLTPVYTEIYDTVYTAKHAFDRVIEYAGASLFRDSVDARIVYETLSGTYTFEGSNGSTGGIIDSQNDVGGWPILKSTEPPNDSDRDGMPDDWEIANGLDPKKADSRWYHLHPFYTNLEVYINSLVDHIIEQKK